MLFFLWIRNTDWIWVHIAKKCWIRICIKMYADLNHCFFLILLLLFTDEMLVTSVDRGGQLEALRAAEQLTDVTIMAEGVRIPAHKLLLSLHSHYFRSGDDYCTKMVPYLLLILYGTFGFESNCILSSGKFNV